MKLDDVLTKLYSLLEGWGLSKDDFVLVDEFAYLLQRYNLDGPEIKSKHLDLYVNPKALPWKPKNERSTIPPANSPYMRNYEYFMRNTGYSLDLLVADPKIMNAEKVDYKLKDGNTIPLMEVEEMTLQFANHTILHYSLEDVGKEKIIEWFKKFKKIKELAKNKNNQKLYKLTQSLIAKAQRRWKGSVNL